MASSSTGVDTVSELFMYELFVICQSKDLSIEALQAKIKLLPSHIGTLYSSLPFFHAACMNENITLEIIEYLLDVFPLVENLPTAFFCREGTTTSYALHCACVNDCCPNEVVELLVKKCSIALGHYCLIEKGLRYHDDEDTNTGGLPLHYYLARESNVNIDTVKILVEAYPQTLGDVGEWVDLIMMSVPPIHVVVSNKNNIKIDDLYGIITFFIQQSSQIMRVVDIHDSTPLHRVCMNERMTLELFQLVFNAWPEAMRSRDNGQYLPIHDLCCNKQLDDTASLDILRFMLKVDPTVLREIDEDGYLPIYHAAAWKSNMFCKELIDAYPESLIRDCRWIHPVDGYVPIHEACRWGTRDDTVDTIQYMLELHPESLHARDERGRLPIHNAAEGGNVKVIELLLMHDPSAASKETTCEKRELPLHIASDSGNFGAVQVLYDSYPEAILTRNGNGKTPFDVAKSNVSLFLEAQFLCAEEVQDSTMTFLDKNGWLPLHHALKECAPLGSIKLIVKGNPSAVQTADNNMAFPLHIACEFSSVKVVKFLVEKFGRSVDNCDDNKDSILHYACRGGNLGVVEYLLKEQAHLVESTTVNAQNELPIHLLCESCRGGGDGSDSIEYIETIWLLLLANPEVVMA